MKQEHVAMAPNGRPVIPAPLRAALGMEAGGMFVASVEDGSIRLVPLKEVSARMQANVRRYAPAGTDLAGELGRDRRREAAADE